MKSAFALKSILLSVMITLFATNSVFAMGMDPVTRMGIGNRNNITALGEIDRQGTPIVMYFDKANNRIISDRGSILLDEGTMPITLNNKVYLLNFKNRSISELDVEESIESNSLELK